MSLEDAMIGPSEHRTDPLAVSQREELSALDDDASAIAKVIEIIGRNVEVPEHFRTHTAHKLANIDRLGDRAVKCTVELFHESNPRQSKACQRIEIAITGPGATLRAEGSGPDFYVALAAALTKLHERQRRSRDRRRVRRGRRHPQLFPETTVRPTAPRGELGGTPVSAGGNRGAVTGEHRVDVGPEFRLPRSTGDLSADWRAAEAAVRAAVTEDQRASVRLRMDSLAERQWRATGAVAGCTV
jgi:ribosomal subunit interface protein